MVRKSSTRYALRIQIANQRKVLVVFNKLLCYECIHWKKIHMKCQCKMNDVCIQYQVWEIKEKTPHLLHSVIVFGDSTAELVELNINTVCKAKVSSRALANKPKPGLLFLME